MITQKPLPFPKVTTKTVKTSNEYLLVDAHIPVINGMADKTVEEKLNSARKNKFEREVQEFRAQAEQDYRAHRSFKDGNEFSEVFNQYRYDLNFKTGYVSSRLLVIIEDTNAYTGGAHGIPYREGINIALNSGKNLKLSDWFAPDKNYIVFINDFIRNEIANEADKYFSYRFNGITEEQEYYIDGENLVIIFQVYDIAPYMAGIPEFKIPIKKLEEYGFKKELL